MINESEFYRLSIPWVMARTSRLLSKGGTVVVDSGAAGDGPVEGAITLKSASGSEIGEPIFMKEDVKLEPFQTQILECRTKPLHVLMMPLKAGELQLGARPLPLGLHVLHTYTSSSKVSVVVRNMLESPIFLKKEGRWHEWFLPCWCPLQSCHWRWRPLWELKLCRNLCL